MSKLEQLELMLIVVAVGFTAYISFGWQATVGVDKLVLNGAVILLLQGLLRDLALLWQAKRRSREQSIEASCMCVESTVGGLGVIIGLLLWAAGVAPTISLSYLTWPIATAVVLLFGFAIKDFVIGWRPLTIRKLPNHHNIIVRW